jgi:anti-sigma-K factor RskA
VESKQWEQMVVELLASCDNRPPDPGKPDEVAIARYLSGVCTSDERVEIERAMAKSPELSECVALAREVLAKTEAAA